MTNPPYRSKLYEKLRDIKRHMTVKAINPITTLEYYITNNECIKTILNDITKSDYNNIEGTG